MPKEVYIETSPTITALAFLLCRINSASALKLVLAGTEINSALEVAISQIYPLI